jgi:RNA polymerase sigma factor (sigma-70 family)
MKSMPLYTPSETFEKELKEHNKVLLMQALHLTRNMDDAKDLVQDTLLKALRYKDQFNTGSNLKAWLYTILKNSFINHYRRMSKRNTFIDSTDNTYFLDAPSQKLENQGELYFIRKDLETAIDTLPIDLKVTFLMNTEGYKYQEIADTLQIPIGTVKTRIFVARKLLRQKLHVYGEGLTSQKSVNE